MTWRRAGAQKRTTNCDAGTGRAPRPVEATRSGARWTADDDEFLSTHAALNPAVLAALLGRSDHAVVSRLLRLGLRADRWRSPHHPSPSRGGLTPGERALVERELRDQGSRAIVSLAERLERPRGAITDVARLLCASHGGR